jgi:hypothetical protein
VALMNLALVALVGWIGLTVALFAKLAPRRAILVSVLGGWLFLPLVTVPIPGPLPDLDKTTAIYTGVFLGMLFFDRVSFLRFHPTWFDAPMAVWVLSPFLSSLANGLGAYDGMSAVFENLVKWGLPYWLGRIYFFERDALRDLAWGIFIGGLLYIPFCWFEIFNGPYLHWYAYGIYPDAAKYAYRLGGWRPLVFMQHGLMVALWMTLASVCGVILYLGGAFQEWKRWRGIAGVSALVVTTFALRSVNAWALLAFTLVLLAVSTRMQRAWLLWLTDAVIFLYLGLRVTGLWYAFEVAHAVGAILGEKKESLLFRFVNEIQIAEPARLQPLWGWGRWGRACIGREGGLPVLTPDSVWIAALGQQGFGGFFAILGVLFLPTLLFSVRAAPKTWLTREIAPVTACAFVVLIFALDSLANAMLIPASLIATGGIVGWFVATQGSKDKV